ncbi:S35B1 protein, partial [Ceuthmochares aereus]|nr:S35B1 protein [Ceuthmochares aereus]
TRGRYGEGTKQEKFKYALTLVFIQCVINAAFARLLIQFFDPVKADRTRSWLYAACSLSYLGAMVSSNSALQFVSYPTQVLRRSLKQSLLLGGCVVRCCCPVGRPYRVLLEAASGWAEPCSPSTAGIISLPVNGMRIVTWCGQRLIGLSLGSELMLLILIFLPGILFTGELWEFLSFTERYPSIIYNILLFGLTSALGQSFIFMTVVYFGPLTCSIITTTRKFFTILASVILFANPISALQWVGTVLVFLGLGLDARFGKGVKKTSH